VIVTDLPIFKEFKDELYKIRTCSPDAIADGIIELYGNNDEKARIIASSKKLIDKNRWENIVNLYYEKYLRKLKLSSPKR